MADFNAFQRELQKRGIDEQNSYMFTLLFERLIQTEKVVMDGMKVLTALANSMQGFVELNEAQEKKIQQIAKGQFHDGIDVSSVAYDPDKDKN